MVFLKADEAFIFVLSKYTNFPNIFSKNLTTKFSKYIRINDYAIDLIKDKLPLYRPIYSLELV